MKGIVFNLLERAVTQDHGADTWDDLLEAAKLKGAYTAVGNYPDEQLLRLVEVASAALGLPAEKIVHWFGKSALPMLAESYGDFFAGHKTTKEFLLTLNEVIHPEVRKLYPGADVPTFDFESPAEDVLLIGYHSKRRLCSFAAGLIEAAAGHYGEQVEVEHPRCMHRGDEGCLIRCTFSPRPD